MLAQSHPQRHPSMPRYQERERGRSRIPKPTLALGRQEPLCHSHRRISSDVTHTIPRAARVERVIRAPRRIPRKGKSPDRSVPGALEVAIQEAHARGDLRQCLQWVLEIQGIYLEWDDPRLDTVTEDDLSFSEQTGMGPDATPEERRRAEAYWAMRQAEEDEAERVWALTATPAEKEASRRFKAQLAAEQRKREARVEFFRAPRQGKCAPVVASPKQPVAAPSTPSLPLDSGIGRTYTIPRTSRSQPQDLFPLDEDESMAVRAMWLGQRRKGLALVEGLVRPPPEPSVKAQDAPEPRSPAASELQRPDSPDDSAASSSSSSSSSAPSELFSSVTTTTSTATSESIICSGTPHTSDQTTKSASLPPKKAVVATSVETPKFISVSTSESPLHVHLNHLSLLKSREGDDIEHSHTASVVERLGSPPRRSRPRSNSESWLLTKGGKTVAGLVDLIGRLPSSYLPSSQPDTPPFRATSCPPPANRTRLPSAPFPTLPPTTLEPESETDTYIYLLPLRPPSYPLTFSPPRSLPRSPFCPLFPPPYPTPRPRIVPNPQFLRLKALQNRVLWGLVPMPRAECDMLAGITQRHRLDALPGRPDVDRLGQMFTAREARLRVVVEGVGRSPLRNDLAAPSPEGLSVWSWFRS